MQNRHFYKKRKCTHTIKITDKYSENMLGIDFLQKHRLHLDQKTWQTSFLQTLSKAMFATRNFTLLPLATTLIQARSFQAINEEENYIADIRVPKSPLISGPSTWVNCDENNHCTIQLQNCAPHEISIEAGDMLGIVDSKATTPIPLNDNSIATICDQIHQQQPKVKKKTLTRNEIEKRCNLGAPEVYRARYIDTLFRHQAAISMDQYDLGLAKDFTHRIHLKDNKPIY